MSRLRTVVDRVDTALARLSGRRRVLVDVRTPMNFAILAPMVERLQRDPRIELLCSSDRPADIAAAAAAAGVRAATHERSAMTWRRVDLVLSSDPWDPIQLRRCLRRANFFHGVAGKYDLDSPASLPIGFDIYDRLAFVNGDRMRRYTIAGIVRPDAAVLVGYPKIDALVNGRFDAAAIRARLQLEIRRPTAIYAPTWSPASSLHLAGEAIVSSLVDAGFNVIVKLHDRSLDLSDERFSGGIDWRARFARLHRPARTAFVESADSSPLVAASDVMVTDHSSIGYEFCLLDRPLIVFDTPDLARVARINPEKIAQLRSAARVVTRAAEIGPAALDELDHLDRRADARRAIGSEMFHEPGTATERALDMIYGLLDIRWGSAPHPGSVVRGGPGATLRSLAGAPSAAAVSASPLGSVARADVNVPMQSFAGAPGAADGQPDASAGRHAPATPNLGSAGH